MLLRLLTSFCVGVLLHPGRAAGAQPTFRIPIAIPAGNEAEALAAADVDGDDDTDIAIANAGDGTISILHNDGAGNHTVRLTDRVGLRPRHLLLEDTDRDGDPDLLVANQNSANISVLVNRGGGAFSARVNYPAGTTPQYLAAGDLDGDADLDVAVANGAAGAVTVLRNVSGTAFQIATTIFIDDEINAVALGDMDGDGDPDVVATNRYLGRITVLRNYGGLVFAAPQAYKTATRVVGLVLADIDGDADVDVVTAHAEERALTVLLNSGDGNLARAAYYGTANTAATARTLKCGDLDGDGDTDLVVVNGPGSGSTLALFFNAGDGSFGPPLNLQVSHDGREVLPLYDAVVAAFDSVPGTDVATVGHVTAPGFSGVALAFNDPRHACLEFPRPLPTGADPATLAAADLNADTWPDLAVLDLKDGEIAVHLNSGHGDFVAPQFWDAGLRPAALVAGDFDADGDTDLATADADPSTDVITLHWNDGTGSWSEATALPRAGTTRAGTVHLAAADLDGDTDLDLVSADSVAGRVCVLANAGSGVFTNCVAYSDHTHPCDVRCGDMDGDGDVDLVVAGDGTSATLLWNAGDGSFPSRALLPIGYGQKAHAIADLDGDGDLDIASALRGIATAAVCLNGGGGRFAAAEMLYVGNAAGASDILSADAEGDGDVDLLFAHRATGSVALLENVGAGGFALPVHLAAGVQPSHLAHADVDGDDDEDVAVANEGAGVVSILVNTTRTVPVLLARFGASETEHGTVLLTWDVNGSSAVQGFWIERAERGSASAAVTPLLAASARAYEDTRTRPGVTYHYVLVVRDWRGAVQRSAGVEFGRAGTRLQLLPAIPNPCHDTTTIRVAVPETMPIEVALYDVRGRHVAHLVDAVLPRGVHALRWSGRDTYAARVPPGVYFCRMRAGPAFLVEKVVVVARSPQR